MESRTESIPTNVKNDLINFDIRPHFSRTRFLRSSADDEYRQLSKKRKIIINNKMKIYNTKILSIESPIKYDFDIFLIFILLPSSVSLFFSFFRIVNPHDRISHKYKKRIQQNCCDLSIDRPIGITSTIFCR